MAYGVELSTEVDRELDKLSAQHSKRILKSLHARVAKLDGPTQHWRGAARLAACGVLEISRGRLPAHLQDRGRSSGSSGPSHRRSQRNLSLALYLKLPV